MIKTNRNIFVRFGSKENFENLENFEETSFKQFYRVSRFTFVFHYLKCFLIINRITWFLKNIVLQFYGTCIIYN